MLRVSQAEGKWTVETLWKNMAIQGKMSSPVVYQGFLYGLNDGVLVCVDQQTGKKAWTGRRYGHGQLLLTGDLLLILSEQGELALVEAQPGEFRELGRRKALEGKTWNNPALVLGKLFIRNDEEMACYDVSDPTVTKWP
jgi:outer membrane protein assembly factor BamB